MEKKIETEKQIPVKGITVEEIMGLDKFFRHGNGIALVPDRTSSPWWQSNAVKAELILFTAGKLKFISANGVPGNSPAQGTTLLAVGRQGCEALRRAADRGLGLLMVPR